MAKNKLSDLRDHLFSSIEMLKNNSDPEADDCEKMDLDTAKQIANISGRIIDTYKVEVQAMAIVSKGQNPTLMNELLNNTGVFSSDVKALAQ